MDAQLQMGIAQTAPLGIQRWPSELPLRAGVILASLVLWAVLALSVIGFAYALMIGAFLFLAHVAFVAHVRGNGVRLGADQFPRLHARVEELALRSGLKRVPEAYLMQAGGSLNALATRFLGSGVIVLFSDLVDACGEDQAALDMVVGHELGHLAAGHLVARGLLFPGMLVPFLGPAYSQACEYTCDRYGAALCGDAGAALKGLGILAAGGAHGRRLDFAALARQREALDTGWMTLGRWLMSHPPLCLRVAALEPSLAADLPASNRGPVRAVVIAAGLLVLPAIGVAVFGALFARQLQTALHQARFGSALAADAPSFDPPADIEAAAARARSDLAAMAEVAREHREETGAPPVDGAALVDAWRARHGGSPPVDPFDGFSYGYSVTRDRFLLWSSGPDGESGSDDDIEVEG
jgi:Zn-dependent protease with chaperone function